SALELVHAHGFAVDSEPAETGDVLRGGVSRVSWRDVLAADPTFQMADVVWLVVAVPELLAVLHPEERWRFVRGAWVVRGRWHVADVPPVLMAVRVDESPQGVWAVVRRDVHQFLPELEDIGADSYRAHHLASEEAASRQH